MTIHELANAVNAEKLELPFNLSGDWKQFPPDKADILVAFQGKLVIGINRESGLFAAQRGSFIVTGFVETELAQTQVEALSKKAGD